MTARPWARSATSVAVLLAVALAIAAASLLVVAPAPSYDPWAWLLWGREIAVGELSTSGGPAFKPLPVAVCALLAPLGDAAPAAWVLLGRVGAVLAVLLAFRLGRRLAGGSAVAGGLAAAGVVLSGGFLVYAASGIVSGWVVALALAGVEAWRAGRPRVALACGVGCGLLQVEAWPFLMLLGLALWRRRPRDRPLLVALAVALPTLWLGPELLGSGDLLRSAERARIPNPGQPALTAVPALASLREAAGLILWPLGFGAAALALLAPRGRPGARTALAPAAAGSAWVAIVAAMAQLGGFSGEPRYALPGMALIAISGAVGLVAALRSAGTWGAARVGGRTGARVAARAGRRDRPRVGTWRVARLAPRAAAAAAAIALVAVATIPRLDGIAGLPDAQAHQWELARDLAEAVEVAGGREVLLRCGQPYVGPLRGPLMAYQLDVEKRRVEPDLRPTSPGIVFRSRLGRAGEFEPRVGTRFGTIAATEHWHVLGSCRG